ncbi:hypothetical protein [Corynebacterium sp. Marseille-P3884]|uniref:hypothetical protein n=1 Tax=Corynebacterium sp. Marseille-P3884 TaxID=2495409 RepID=UPI001B323E28|nr:hypothetical protein [Corynebacterium sp. Marseille-P3884]MBP3949466.1 hypothetical protein [Corynebacterium sp. Marseille-P3884]
MNTSLLGYFRHQFVAAPLTRLLWMVPILAMLASGVLYATRDTPIAVIFGPMMLTVFMISALSLEDTAYTAYGMPKSRTMKLAAVAVVPAVLFGATIALLARPDWVGIAGALVALVSGVLFGGKFIAGDAVVSDREADSHIGRGSFEFELIFKPQLLWALGVAVAHCIFLYLSDFIGNDTFGQLFGGLPIMIWYSAYCMQGLGIPGTATGASFGVPRRRWLALSWVAALVSAATYIGLAGLVSPSEFSWAAVATIGIGGLASAVIGAAVKIWRTELGMLPGYMMFFIANGASDAQGFLDGAVIFALVTAGILALVGIVIQAGYLVGLINPNHAKDKA